MFKYMPGFYACFAPLIACRTEVQQQPAKSLYRFVLSGISPRAASKHAKQPTVLGTIGCLQLLPTCRTLLSGASAPPPKRPRKQLDDGIHPEALQDDQCRHDVKPVPGLNFDHDMDGSVAEQQHEV